jgi:cytochrome d ubiquinol oxidase subunit I
MQTPTGFELRDGVAYVTDWWAAIFNPSFPYRLAHMLIASGLTVAFLIAGVSAYRWLRGDRQPDVLAALRTGTYLAAILIPVQILVGDLHGLNTLEHQPAKVAAMEGLWETGPGAPAVLFGLPDEEARKNHFVLAIPNLASLYLVHSWEGEVRGLNDFVGEHPPVAPVFFAFRVMVGVGVLMLLVSWITARTLWKRGEPTRRQARWLVAMTFAGWVAVLAGWYTTEIGRQPWLVQGVLATADAAADVAAPMIALSLALYLVLYVTLIAAYVSVLFYLARKAAEDGVPSEPMIGPSTPPARGREAANA